MLEKLNKVNDSLNKRNKVYKMNELNKVLEDYTQSETVEMFVNGNFSSADSYFEFNRDGNLISHHTLEDVLSKYENIA